MSKKSKDTKAFPLNETLRDLALLRSSDIDLSKLGLKPESSSSQEVEGEVSDSVKLSYEYVAEAKKVMAIANKGTVDSLADNIESLRGQLDEISQGFTWRGLMAYTKLNNMKNDVLFSMRTRI
ncbi:hypothetical protein PC9H_007682 [Pleurotus ostreatus]|uniref:Uncharacterized protein n=1 Tax=Pleurotus ostreatus TaxID=5322 RepID=A0A8H6ZVR9_PLEOS|nr:uncharacterized protein PC9H_007682 [Pleurotus ostreatus]KAF7428458.1 hypothetical protein PC9H_007682 [Pleurotus ostreatus]